MKHIRDLRQGEHYHLERHDHGKYAQIVNGLGKFILHAGDVPRAHGGAQNDHEHGADGDEEGPAGGLKEFDLLDALHIVLKAHQHFPGRKRKGLAADVRLFLLSHLKLIQIRLRILIKQLNYQ